jgi:hypothetical protein
MSMAGLVFPGENGGSDEAVVGGDEAIVGGDDTSGTRRGQARAVIEPGTKVHAGDPSCLFILD